VRQCVAEIGTCFGQQRGAWGRGDVITEKLIIYIIMKNLGLAVFTIICFSCVKAQDPNILWSDEFNYSGLPDQKKWGNEVGYIRNHEQQYYTNRRIENSVVKNGYLMLIGRKEPYQNYNYTSASINTLGKFSIKYGKVEARMKLPVGQGMWPAFWMMGVNRPQVGWPKCGEIDIMEHINSTLILHGTAHWDNNGHLSSGKTTSCDVREFHNYTVEWDQDSIRWFLDETRYHSVSIKDGENGTQEFHEPFYLLLNLAIGGDWPKNPDGTTQFPDTVFIDYVRVYQKLAK
jgi:beta-glucanase (GH16 family)